MKALFVLGFPNPFPGAGWARIHFFARHWTQLGNRVETLGMFSLRSFRKSGSRCVDNVNTLNLIFNIGIVNPFIFAFNSLVALLVSILVLLVKSPDVTIVSLPNGQVGLGALMACKITGVKCVVDYRDEWEDYTISFSNSRIGAFFYSTVKKLTASLYAKCHLVVVVTPNIMTLLNRRGVTNIKVVPNGADIKTFKPLSSRKKNKVFVVFYSGGIEEYYRLNVILKSLKKLVDNGFDNFKLIIAGKGEIQKVINLALEMGILHNVEYKGAINDKAKLAKLITEADVGLVPYDDNPLWKNSLPAKFFEYCACRTPVVATVHEDSILAKLIKEYEVGLTVPPMDEEKLAEAIYRIYKDESFRDSAGKRARSLIVEKFDRNKISKMFLSLVEQLVHSSD